MPVVFVSPHVWRSPPYGVIAQPEYWVGLYDKGDVIVMRGVFGDLYPESPGEWSQVWSPMEVCSGVSALRAWLTSQVAALPRV